MMTIWSKLGLGFALGLVPLAVVAAPTGEKPAAEGKADEPKTTGAKETSHQPAKRAPTKRAARRRAAQPHQDSGPLLREANKLRSSMLENVSELEALEQQARKDGDMARLGCIRDKQELAEKLLDDVVAPEVLVVLDTSATARQRRFATQKLAEASAKLNGIVERARACSGQSGPEEEDGKTRNEVDLQRFIPFLDPTLTPVQPPVPPPVDDTRPPVVQSPVM